MRVLLNIFAVAIIMVSALQSVKGQTASFMDVNPDPIAMGMANANSVVYANAFSIWNNSANSVFSENKMDVAASYGIWQPSSSKNNVIAVAGYGKIAKFMAVTAGVKYFTHKPFQYTDNYSNVKGSYTPKELSAGIGLAFRILPILSASVNFNYILSDMANDNVTSGAKAANAFAADAGLLLHLKHFNVALTASNIGTKINYGSTNSYSLPANLRLGAGTSYVFNKKHKLTANLQGGMLFSNSAFFGEIGAEYMFNDMVAIRAGYHYGDKNKYTPSYASVGLGAKFFGISLNAAYLLAGSSSPIGNSFNVSLGWGF